jgi:putative N-acetylmannosamine-6-phosphate epimerase
MGARGVDLLAYRATEADPIDLVRAARKALKGELIVAGSIASPERIRAVRDAGADAFTIGTAAIAGTFAKDRTGLTAQLEAILDAVAQA